MEVVGNDICFSFYEVWFDYVEVEVNVFGCVVCYEWEVFFKYWVD